MAGAGYPASAVWHWLNHNAGGVEAAATVILVVVTGAYVVLTWWQVRSAARAAKADATLSVVQFLQRPDIRLARKTVREMGPQESDEGWSDVQKEAVGLVCSSFDSICMLSSRKLVDQDTFIEMWGASMVWCYQACRPYVLRLRERHGFEDYYKYFHDCVEQAKRRGVSELQAGEGEDTEAARPSVE